MPPGFQPLRKTYPEATAFIEKVCRMGGRGNAHISGFPDGANMFIQVRALPDVGAGVHVPCDVLAGVTMSLVDRQRVIAAIWETGLFGDVDEGAGNPNLIDCRACTTRFPFPAPTMLPPDAKTNCPACGAEIHLQLR